MTVEILNEVVSELNQYLGDVVTVEPRYTNEGEEFMVIVFPKYYGHNRISFVEQSQRWYSTITSNFHETFIECLQGLEMEL